MVQMQAPTEAVIQAPPSSLNVALHVAFVPLIYLPRLICATFAYARSFETGSLWSPPGDI